MSFQGVVAPLAQETVAELSEAARRDLARMRAAIVELERGHTKLKDENEHLIGERDELQGEIDQLREENSQLREKNSELETMLAVATEDAEVGRGDRDEARYQLKHVLDHLDSAWGTRA